MSVSSHPINFKIYTYPLTNVTIRSGVGDENLDQANSWCMRSINLDAREHLLAFEGAIGIMEPDDDDFAFVGRLVGRCGAAW